VIQLARQRKYLEGKEAKERSKNATITSGEDGENNTQEKEGYDAQGKLIEKKPPLTDH